MSEEKINDQLEPENKESPKKQSLLTIILGAATAVCAILAIVFLVLWLGAKDDDTVDHNSNNGSSTGNNGSQTDEETEVRNDEISVNSDGYVVVNGIKTEHKVHITDEITISNDGYLIVNGVKTEYEIKNKNHSFSDWELYSEAETDCEKKLYYRVCSDCSTIEWKEGKYEDHNFNTVTTKPTCQAGGYDTKTCQTCGKVEIVNETPIAAHNYNTEYTTDNAYHWFKCKGCDSISGKAEHTLSDDGSCSLCSEQVGPTEGIIYDISADGTYAEVIGYEGTATKIKIADSYNGLPVKTIYKETFKNKSIKSVIIPDSVTSIGDGAFKYCSSLESVVIGDSVTSIGIYAFYGCSSLESVVIGDSVTSIGNSAFYECSSLTNIVIPSSVTRIGSDAFYGCSSLESVVIGDSVTSIGNSAFSGCSSLKSVVIGDSVTSIGIYAFSYCSLTNIVIPSSVTRIGSDAFSGCTKLIKEYNNCLYVGSEDDPYIVLIEVSNENLSTYDIHPDTRIIADSAFVGCSRLSSIIIPDGVTSIGYEEFYKCTSLTSITIPDSVTSIDSYAFWGCSSLTEIVIPDSVTSIGSYAFRYCSSLESVVIGDSVTSIGEFAFSDCSSLTSVVIGDSVTSIGIYAFSYCSLTNIVIPSSVTSIGSSAFNSCSSFTDVYYTGSKEDWTKIEIGYNPELTSAIKHYNYVPEE